MALWSVTLDTSAEPRFPDRCVVCAQPHPDDFLRVADRAWSWTVLFFPLLHFAQVRKSVEVPVCRDCRAVFRRQRWLRIAVLWGIFVAVAVVGIPLVQAWKANVAVLRSRTVQKLAILAAVVVFAVPLLLWEYIFPKHFDLDVGARTTDYDFRSPDYAGEFARLNNAEVQDL